MKSAGFSLNCSILSSAWVDLLWMHFSTVKQGPRTIDMRAFQFDYFIVIIREAIRASAGLAKKNSCPAATGSEKGGWRDGELYEGGKKLAKYWVPVIISLAGFGV